MIYNNRFDYGLIALVTKNVSQMSTNFDSGIPEAFVATFRRPPGPVTQLLSPVDTKRVPAQFTFVTGAGTSPEGAPLHYILQISADPNFSTIKNEWKSQYIQTGWEYSTDNGQTWYPIPSQGAPATANRIRYTLQAPLTGYVFGQTYYWRIVVTDTIDTLKPASSSLSFRFGNALIAQFKNPVETANYAVSCIFTIAETIPTDGAVPAVRKLWVCNNGFDDNPTWEDATQAYLNKQAYYFQNRTKTAEKWGVSFKYEVQANDSLGVIELKGFGINFN